jgi:hypothetical protein
MTDLRSRTIGTVTDIYGEELEVAVMWDADPDVDPEWDDYPAVEIAGHTLDQGATGELTRLIAASWEAAATVASPEAEEKADGH